MPEHSRCRVCMAGPAGQRLHRCPDSKYYVPGSDPGAEIPAPKRIQRKRTAGWRMPEGAIYVGRPTKWGNPFSVMQVGDRFPRLTAEQCAGFAVNEFKFDLRCRYPDYPSLDEIQAELAGHDLACWCPPGQPCHADVLLELANTEAAAQ